MLYTSNKFVICPYRDDAAAAVAQFFSSSHLEDETIVPVTEEAWRGFVSLPSNSGGKDFAIAQVDDKIVAVLSSRRRDNDNDKVRHFRIIVHPHFRRHLIGKAMLEYVVSQDFENNVVLQCTCPEQWIAKTAFLTHNGFTRVHRELSMHRYPLQLQPISLSEGYTIRDYAGSTDSAALANLHNQAYVDSFGFSGVSEAEFVGQSELPGCRIRILTQGLNPIGFCQTLLEDELLGCIESLVISTEYRRRGLGRAILQDAIQYLVDSKVEEIVLNVDADNEAAIRLYRSAEFEETGCTHTYRRMRVLLN